MAATQMVEHADMLVQRAKFWTRGVRKSDGLAFVCFPSSRGGRAAYYTNERACSCPSFQFRHECAHRLAVRAEAEAARERIIEQHEAACREAASGDLVSIFG